MPKLTLYTQAARDSENVAASAEDLVNLYAEKAPGDAVTRVNLKGVLGETLISSIDGVLPRGVGVVDGKMYVSMNGDLYSVTSGGASSFLGAINSSVETSFAGNGSNVTIAAGGNYYVWDGSSLSTPTTNLSTEDSVEFESRRTIVTSEDGTFTWSDINDPTTFDALNFSTVDGRNDTTLRAVAFGGVVYFFGTESIEAWANTGLSGSQAYQRLADGVIDEGLKAYKLVKRFDEGIFFIGDDNTAKILVGNRTMAVSTPPVNTDIEASAPTQVNIYEERGHTFLCVRFSDRPAWIYDTQTKLWHRRQTGVGMEWKTLEIARLGAYYHGFDVFGNIYRMRRTSADVTEALQRVCTSKPIYMDGKKFSIRKLQFLCRVGKSDLGRDAKVVLQVSRDGGLTWSDEIEGSLGSQGEYETQVEFHSLGRYEQFNARFTVSDAADITIYSDANVEFG